MIAPSLAPWLQLMGVVLDGTSHRGVLLDVRRGVVGETPATPSAVHVPATPAGRVLCAAEVRLRSNMLGRCHLCTEFVFVNVQETVILGMFELVMSCSSTL